MGARRIISLKLIVSVALFALAMVGSLPVSAESSSDTGSVTVEIVPPGGLDRPEVPAGEVYIPAGTLSTKILYLSDPVTGQSILDGVLVVEDHRAESDGWTVHLRETTGSSEFLGRVIIGAEGWGISGWIYEGVHAWDTAAGMSLSEAPPLMTAPVGTGNGITLSYTEIAINPWAIGPEFERGVLNLIIPAAP